MVLSEQYDRLDQWFEQLSHFQYTLAIAIIWTIMWATTTSFLTDQSFWSSVLVGAFGGLIFGGLHYFWPHEN